MLILSPVDSAAEGEALIDAGADELYAGYVPEFWADEFGLLVSCNRRTYKEANLGSREELDELASASAERGVPVYLALNAWPIVNELIPRLVEFVADLDAHSDVRGVIVADLSLLLALRVAALPRMELHASVGFSAFNTPAIGFLKRAGALRVILPRDLTVTQISELVASNEGTPLEAIGIRGKCPNIEGFCTHLHDDPDRRWPCELHYDKEWRGDGEDAFASVRALLERNEGKRGSGRKGLPFSCGLCAIPLLDRAGVHSFKLVGRGVETPGKVKAVVATRRMLDWGRQAHPDAASCAREGKSIYEELFGQPCEPKHCYFPEFGPGEDA